MENNLKTSLLKYMIQFYKKKTQKNTKIAQK